MGLFNTIFGKPPPLPFPLIPGPTSAEIMATLAAKESECWLYVPANGGYWRPIKHWAYAELATMFAWELADGMQLLRIDRR